MALSNVPSLPKVWSEQELSAEAQKSINAFVDRRLQEPADRLLVHVHARRKSVLRLFKLLVGIDPAAPDPTIVRQIMADPLLNSALRYVVGPPVSEDDLSVLATRSAKKFSKRRLNSDDAFASDILKLICSLADRVRFPWIVDQRTPMPHELKYAVRATTALNAAQSLQTERRQFGKKVEAALASRLITEGFDQIGRPPKGKVTSHLQWPEAGKFYGECTVYGRKSDLFIGLKEGRVVAVEAKDSASALNSVKRVLNDTAAKATHWKDAAGQNLIPVALLSGVFSVDNLKSAQQKGLYLVWTHELDSFVDWLSAHTD